jgi:hypothetical protein
MATFCDEPALPTAETTWARIKSLVTAGKTVEVYRKSVDGQQKLFLRVWTGKRKDGSNLVAADPGAEY